MENDKSLKNKRTFKGILVALLALLSVYSCTLPAISSEFCKKSWIMETLIGGSILCGLAFYIIVIVRSIKNGKKNKKYYYDILYTTPLLVLETLNILAIFDYEIWGHKSTLAGLSLIFIMFVEFFACIRTIFKKSFGRENAPVTLIVLTIISFLIAAVNEGVGNIEPASLCYKVCFGLAYLVAITLYTHQFIYKTKKSEKIVSNIIGIIFFGAAITITFPYYIKWCGLSKSAFETFVTVYAAVLGGGITLAGVAWTIKKADADRRATQQLALKPWIFLMRGYLSQEEKKKLPKYTFSTSGVEQSDAKRFCILKNTDNGIAILKEISSKQYRYIPIGDAIVDKNSIFYLYVDFEDDDKKEELRLTIEDVLHNEYNYKLSATEYPNVINTLTEEQHNEQYIF